MATLIQRPLKGSRISTFYPVKALPPLASLDSAFQLQEYISLLIRLDVHDVESIVSLPGVQQPRETDFSDDYKGEEKENERDGKNEVVVDDGCWIYEQLRRLAQDLTHPLITMLQQECTRATCPEMKAGEWLYLCVAHGSEGAMEQCCAIDYILHTLDSATALLNSPRAFPSRLAVPQTSRRHFSSLARRLGRIFAHAYFHHREAFEQAEAESSLYARFLALTSKFNLVPSEFLVIPPRLSSLHDDSRSDRNLDSRDPTAEIDPLRFLGPDLQGSHDGETRPWSMSNSGSMVDLGVGTVIGRRSNLPGAINRTESPPRRFGRSRTDTMIYSEAMNVVEELARGENVSDAGLDRAISEETALGTSGQVTLPVSESANPDVEQAPSRAEPPTLVISDSEEVEIPSTTPDADPIPAPLAEDILEIVEPGPTEPHIPFDVEEEEPLSPDEEEEPGIPKDEPELSFSAVEEAEVEAQLGTGSTPEIRIDAPVPEPDGLVPTSQAEAPLSYPPPPSEPVIPAEPEEPEAIVSTETSVEMVVEPQELHEDKGEEEAPQVTPAEVALPPEEPSETQVPAEPAQPRDVEVADEAAEDKEVEVIVDEKLDES